jgi:hypothetical protein
LVTQGVFPWNRQDADARWAQVQKQATTDQANCTEDLLLTPTDLQFRGRPDAHRDWGCRQIAPTKLQA